MLFRKGLRRPARFRENRSSRAHPGELPIIQLGGTASMQAIFAGADTVIVATILNKFLFSIFSRPEITRMADRALNRPGRTSRPAVLSRTLAYRNHRLT
jgi:hypothetical protein